MPTADADKVALDVGMGAVGLIEAPEAFAISTSYFVVDEFIGWERLGQFAEKLNDVDEDELNQQLNNMGFSGGW